MKLGDMLCPWHPWLTLFECQHLHEAVVALHDEADPDQDEPHAQ